MCKYAQICGPRNPSPPQGGNNQPAPQPHYTNFQLNPIYFRWNLCGQNEPHGKTPQRAQQQSREEDRGDQGGEHTWSLWLWGARKSRRAEPQPTGAPPPQGYNTNTTRPLLFGEKFRWYTPDLLSLHRDRILGEKRRRGWTGDYPNGGTQMYILGPDRVYLVQVVQAMRGYQRKGYGHPKCLSRENGYTSQWTT